MDLTADTITFVPEVLSFNDYYPYGMLVPTRNYSSPEYRYGFQGQEKDDEVKGSGNSINYKYRMHDSRVGRFFAVDPLAQKYPHNSVYAFSENRVNDGIELEGAENILVRYVWDKDKKAYLKTLEMGLGLKLFQSGIRTEYYGGPYVKEGFDYRAIYEPNKYSILPSYDIQSKDADRALKELKVFQELKNKAVILDYKAEINNKYIGVEGKATMVVSETSLRIVREEGVDKYYPKIDIKPKLEVEGNLIILNAEKIGGKYDTNGNKTIGISLFDVFNIKTKEDKDNNFINTDIYLLLFKMKTKKAAGITNIMTYKVGVTRTKATIEDTDDDTKKIDVKKNR
ncbi:MAG TPA: hypothetical protein ENK66_09905 [Arcobacter sp.]|nr:hypothetical protein [Arcobacter sp.]